MSAVEVYDGADYEVGPIPSEAERLTAVVPLHKAYSPRARRRRIKRRQNRSVRPTDPITVKTVPWYHSRKKQGAAQKGDGRPVLLQRVHQGEIQQVLETDDDDPVKDRFIEEPSAPVMVRRPEVEFGDLAGVTSLTTDSEFNGVLLGDETPDEFHDGLPEGFMLVNGGGVYSRQLERRRLQQAAEIEPDWGDPEGWDMGRFEPNYLIVRT